MTKRRLAAIMFSDIIIYNSLVKEDENKAFEILRINQQIHRRLIKKFNGRSLKEMGSGILASFRSNIDAVMCAVSIQRVTEEINIPVRIGIHQGDVVFEKNDVFGDGVNIASRIQSFNAKHAIVISDTVYKDIRNKEGLVFESLGTHTLKGVQSPISLYIVSCNDESLLDFTIDTGELLRPSGFRRAIIIGLGISVIALLVLVFYYFIPKSIQLSSESGRSLLILPFNNYLGTDTMDYFVAGMHNELISDIGKINTLHVKSKTTANAYKNTNKSIPEIADELKVNTFIEGAVMCIGDSVCLQVKLLDQGENELWIQDFKVERSQILSLYNKVTKDIIDRIDVVLTPQQQKLLSESRTVDSKAYDLYMKGMVYNDQMSEEALKRAYQYFQLANEIDPYWAAPYRGMASVLERQYQMGFMERSMVMPKLNEYIDKSMELDPDDAWIYNLRGSKAGWFEYDWEKAEKDFLKSIELNPNHSGNHAFFAAILTHLRRTDEALYHVEIAAELDPLYPLILGICANVQIQAGECQVAIDLIEKAISIEPNHFFTYPRLIQASACIGDYQQAFGVIKDINITKWEKYNQTENLENTFNENGWLAFQEELITFYEERGLINTLRDEMDQAFRYIEVKQYDKAMDYFERAFELRSPNLPTISRNITYDRMKNNPRYIELLKKMNLPID